MYGPDVSVANLSCGANKFIEAYHTVLRPLCRELELPAMAVDILLFIANNPQKCTAKDICSCRGIKPGVVSVYIDKLVKCGFIERKNIVRDRRKIQLECTKHAEPVIEKGRLLQKEFENIVTQGLTDADKATFKHCLTTISNNIKSI